MEENKVIIYREIALKCAVELPAPLPEESGTTRVNVVKSPSYLRLKSSGRQEHERKSRVRESVHSQDARQIGRIG